VNFAVENKYSVLRLDTNNVFMRNPLPLLQRSAVRRHILGMRALETGDLGGMNPGFVYIHATKMAASFVSTWKETSFLSGGNSSPQALLNRLLRHYELRQLSQRTLPTNLVMSKDSSMLDGDTGYSKDALVIHWSNMDTRIRNSSYWYIQPSLQCSFIDK